MDTQRHSTVVKGFLQSLKGKGVAVTTRHREDYSRPVRLVVTPGSALTEADRKGLKEHREALLDLLHEELPAEGADINFPYADRPAWMFRGLCTPWESD